MLHNDERIFWRTMTPERCAALYCEYFKLMQPRETSDAATKKVSLSEYLRGGG